MDQWPAFIRHHEQSPWDIADKLQVKHSSSIHPTFNSESIQATPPQVICYDDISDSVKDKLDVVGVCSAGHVGVDLLVG